jgi:hypothetical protein
MSPAISKQRRAEAPATTRNPFVLTVKLPKCEEAKSKKVAVKG